MEEVIQLHVHLCSDILYRKGPQQDLDILLDPGRGRSPRSREYVCRVLGRESRASVD
jgi:hypothetical protein